MQQHYSTMSRRSVYQRKPFGMMMGWLGEWPMLSNLQHGAASGASQQQLLRFVAGNPTPSGLPAGLGMSLSNASTSPRINSIGGNNNNSANVSLAAMQMMMRPMLEQRGMMHANDMLPATDPAAGQHRLSSSSGVQFSKMGSSDSTLLLDSNSGSVYANSSNLPNSNLNRLHHIPNTLSHTLDDQDSVGSVHSGDMLASLANAVGGKSFESPLSVNLNINNNSNITDCTTPMSRAVIALSAPSGSQSFYNDGLLSSTADMLSTSRNIDNFRLSNNLDHVLTLSELSLDSKNNFNNIAFDDVKQVQSRHHSSSHDDTAYPSNQRGSGSGNNSEQSSAALILSFGNGTADIADIIS